jgi:hypothetical protein
MLGLLVLLFPLVVLAFVLLMERVEQPLSRVADERKIEHLLEDEKYEELDEFVRGGNGSALSRFRARLGWPWRRSNGSS